MESIRVYLLGIVAGLVALVWSYWQSDASFELASESSAKLVECQLIAEEIQFLQKRNESAVAIAATNYDPSRTVTDAVRDAGITTGPDFRVNQLRQRLIEGTGAQEWRIDVPPSKVTLTQLVKLIQNLADSEMRFQVNVIRLTAADSANNIEYWNAEFNVTYLKQAAKK